MFIGGQMFDNAATEQAHTLAPHSEDEAAITYHGKPIEVKDRLNRYRALDDNIWNNPYRATSHKIRTFFHAKDQEFKQTHLTDGEIARIQKGQEDDQRKQMHRDARSQALNRIQTRRVERHAVQFKANQAMNEAELEYAGEMSVQNPDTFKQMVMKRSLDFKDPSLSKKPNTQIWNSIQSIPKEKLQMYIRPKILVRDKEACNHIVKKLEEERVTEAITKQWFEQERQETRARLMRQKERNIKTEAKAGVKKSYLPVGLSLAVQDSVGSQQGATGAQNVRLSMATMSNQLTNSIQPQNKDDMIYGNCVNLQSYDSPTSADQRAKTQSALREREDDNKRRSLQPLNDEILAFENEYDAQQDSLEPIKLRAHLANGNQQRKVKTQQGTRKSQGQPMGTLKVNVDMMSPLMDSLDSPRLENRNPTSIQTLNVYESGDTTAQAQLQTPADYASLTNTFKISHLTRPKSYKTSQRLLNLQKPKSVGLKTRRPYNVFDRSDFRGLLYADYRDTIKTAFTSKKSQVIDEGQEVVDLQATQTDGLFVQESASKQDKEGNFDTKGYDSGAFKNFMNTASMPEQARTTTNAVSCTNTRTFYGTQRRATIEFTTQGSQSSNAIVKRPMTAFYSKNRPVHADSIVGSKRRGMSLNADPKLSYQDANGTTVTTKAQLRSNAEAKKRISDPEGIEALKDLDRFEKIQCKKKPNRFAKVNLEQHLSLDETMSQRIKVRAQFTQAKLESQARNYSQKRLINGFKSVRMAQENSKGAAAAIKMKKEFSQTSGVRETATSRITPMGLEIPK